MRLSGRTIGVGIAGSHCSYDEVLPQITRLRQEGATVVPVISETVRTTDTRFTTAHQLRQRLTELTGVAPIDSIVDAEPTGQQKTFDAFVVAPCTGNTLARLANAITDSPVLMAAKGTLRNGRPLVIAVSSNDILSGNALNLALLLTRKHVFFVPFGQDNPDVKPYSCVAEFRLITDTVVAALEGRQLQPLLIQREHRPVR
ncbi:MAG: dipicolinate synthase subunit B [Limnochordales bacterium]|nr:dipicolinate synthase subunit B [Limnochordales bacterium]